LDVDPDKLITITDGGMPYYVGLYSSNPFSSASVEFADDGEINFAYTLDDITLAVPEPSTLSFFGAGLLGVMFWRRYGTRNKR